MTFCSRMATAALSVLMLASAAQAADGGGSTARSAASPASSLATQPPQGMKTLFSNINDAQPQARYDKDWGWAICGPNSANGQVWLALPLQFKRDAVIHEVDLAVGWIYEQPTGIVVSIAADAGGEPGATLATYKLGSYKPFGTCCSLKKAKDPVGVPVSARQTYWLVLTTPADKPEVYAGWNNNLADPARTFAGLWDFGAGWFPVAVNPAPAFAIFGR